MMLKRNLTAAVLIGIALFFILYLRTIYVQLADILFMAVTILGGVEMCLAGKKSGYNAMLLPIIAFSIVVYPLYFFFSISGIMCAFLLAILITLAQFLLKRNLYKLNDTIFTVFVLVYPMLIASLLLYMNNEMGALLGIFYLLFVTLLSDAFALFAGLLFGKKKLCEEVSPKKTVAGAYGAYFGGLLGATVVLLMFDVFRIFDNWGNIGLTYLFDNLAISIPVYLGLALICTTMAIIGDLVASWIKRQAGIKDYGNIFPGHGGMMDRLDSILFVLPILLVFFEIYTGVIA